VTIPPRGADSMTSIRFSYRRSPSSTRATPSGSPTSAATSATLTGTRQSSRIWPRSGPLTECGSADLALRTTISTRSKYRVPSERVRPPVTVYGRETGPDSS
jgi:hypothetical protein